MAGVRVFTDLRCWQRSRVWSKEIFQYTKDSAFKTDRRLVEQVNDSSESVMSNITEGFGRGTQGEFVQFLGYSIGSLNETQSHLAAAFDREYITKDRYVELFQEGTDIRKQIVALITSMVKPGSGVKHMRKQKNWSEEVWEMYERITGEERPELFRKQPES
jgi:four helix bundle protein